MSRKQIVLAYQTACARHDWATLRALLHPQLEFTGPMMRTTAAEEFIAAMQNFGCTFENRIRQCLREGNWVATLLDCEFQQPCAASVRMSEWCEVSEGKIRRIQLVFNPADMPAMTRS
jgi:hypothetical protein